MRKENERLVTLVEMLEKQVKVEKIKSSELHLKLEHHYKTFRMYTGSKELDKILSLWRHEQTSQGLGYNGYGDNDKKTYQVCSKL